MFLVSRWKKSAGPAVPCCGSIRAFRGTPRSDASGMRGRPPPTAGGLQTLLQRVHQVDDIARPFLRLGELDGLARGLSPNQRLQRVFIFIPELRRIEMGGLGV